MRLISVLIERLKVDNHQKPQQRKAWQLIVSYVLHPKMAIKRLSDSLLIFLKIFSEFNQNLNKKTAILNA